VVVKSLSLMEPEQWLKLDTGTDLLAELVAADDQSIAAGAVEAVGVDLHGGVAIKEGVVQDQHILRVVVRIEVELVAVHKDAIEVGGTRGVVLPRNTHCSMMRPSMALKKWMARA
jgi:hypothetical protein